MLIKDIPYSKVRELAVKRASECNSSSGAMLDEAFIWECTHEGCQFWDLVNDGKYDQAAELKPHLFEEGQLDLFPDVTYSHILTSGDSATRIELPVKLKIGDNVKIGPTSYVVQCR